MTNMKNRETTTATEQILKGIREHDTKVLKWVFEKNLPPVRRHVLKNSGTAEDAEDIFMDALEVVYRLLKKNKIHLTCAFGTYLFSICKNLWLKKLRRKKVEKRVTHNGFDVSIPGETPEEEMTNVKRILLYREKLMELPADARRVLEMFYFKGMSMKDIAREMGYSSEGYARKRKYQCMQRLKQLIRDDSRYNFHSGSF